MNNGQNHKVTKATTRPIKLTAISVLMVSASLILPTISSAAYTEDKNWPCLQKKVVKLSAGQMWKGNPLDTSDHSWQSNKPVLGLVNKILARRVPLEETDTIIQTFVKNHKQDSKALLEKTFLGLLAETNKIRAEIISGIGQFTNRQKTLAKRITSTRQKVSVFEKKDIDGTLTKEDDKKLVTLERTLDWDLRIHEEREQSLEYVCEAPIKLEQRLFSLSKQLFEHMPK